MTRATRVHIPSPRVNGIDPIQRDTLELGLVLARVLVLIFSWCYKLWLGWKQRTPRRPRTAIAERNLQVIPMRTSHTAPWNPQSIPAVSSNIPSIVTSESTPSLHQGFQPQLAQTVPWGQNRDPVKVTSVPSLIANQRNPRDSEDDSSLPRDADYDEWLVRLDRQLHQRRDGMDHGLHWRLGQGQLLPPSSSMIRQWRDNQMSKVEELKRQLTKREMESKQDKVEELERRLTLMREVLVSRSRAPGQPTGL